jgi:hypothetical protein
LTIGGDHAKSVRAAAPDEVRKVLTTNGVDLMKTIQTLLSSLFGDDAPRLRARRGPSCEALEHRELLSNVPFGPMMWGGPALSATGGTATPAHVIQFGANGGPGGLHGKGAGVGYIGKHAGGKFTSTPLSPQLKTDFATLQTDMKQLQTEVPAAVTTQLKADQAVIAKAFASLPASKRGAASAEPVDSTTTATANDPPDVKDIVHGSGIMISTSGLGGNSSANMTAMLEKAGVSATEATKVATDFQNYQTTLSTLDPTLHAKITADQAAIAKDGGPTLPTGKAGAAAFADPMD